MSAVEPLRVVFAEEDNMFRLMETAILRRVTPPGEQVLSYFFGNAADKAAADLFAAAEHAGLSEPVEPVVCGPSLQLAQALPADVLVVEAATVTAEHLDGRAGRLKLVQKYGMIAENVDIGQATAHGITVAAMRRKTTVSCAEHTVALILSLARKLMPAHRAVVGGRQAAGGASRGVATKFNWAGMAGVGVVHGATLGLIGFGEIAREVAARAIAMGMEVLYHKRTPVDPVTLPSALRSARPASLDELLQSSDFVSIHVPHTDETERLIDGKALSAMRPSAYLVNIARGSIVDEEALESALIGGTIRGAALDVYRVEPVPGDSGLLRLDNVIWTPHIAGGDPRFLIDEVETVLGNISRVQRGEQPLALI